MNHSWLFSRGLVIAAGIGCLAQVSCAGRISFVDAGVGQLFLHVKKGEKISWSSEIKFKHAANPCKNKNTTPCEIKNDADGVYWYGCPHGECSDPAIYVGSSIGGLGMGGARRQESKTAAVPATIYCNGGSAAADPPTIQLMIGDKRIRWFGDGDVVPAWSIDFLQKGECQKNNLKHDGFTDDSVCEVQKAGTYTYDITATCKDQDGTTHETTGSGMIKIP